MSFAEVPMHAVFCDGCGAMFCDDDGGCGWRSGKRAQEAARGVRRCDTCRSSGTASVRLVQFYGAVCDGCGTRHDDDQYPAWSDKAGAMAAAEGSDWMRQDDDRLLCDGCRSKPGGDQYEPDEADEVAASA